MPKFYIVWNEARNEGFVTDDLDDAKSVQAGDFNGDWSEAGEAFHDVYGDGFLDIQTVEIEPFPTS